MKRRAFTLAETVIVIALVSTFLVVLASLFTRFTTALRTSRDKEGTLSAAADTFETVGADLSSAVNMTSPTTTWSSSINLERLTPYDQSRFPVPLASPNAVWHLHPAPLRERIVYTFAAPNLRRTRVFNAVSTVTTVANQVNFFQCRLILVGGVATDAEMSVTVLRQGIALVLQQRVPLHRPPGGLDP